MSPYIEAKQIIHGGIYTSYTAMISQPVPKGYTREIKTAQKRYRAGGGIVVLNAKYELIFIKK